MWRLLLGLMCCAGAADHVGIVDVRAPAPLQRAQSDVARWQDERVSGFVCAARGVRDPGGTSGCPGPR